MLDENVKVTLDCEDKATPPLEKLIATICDTTGYTEDEIREELAAEGIDLDAEKAKFLPKLDALMAARAGRQAIEALKLIPQCGCCPVPWASGTTMVTDARGRAVRLAEAHNRDKIAAAVNAAPHLLARVAELEAEIAKLKAPNTDTAIHPDGCFSTDPADAADCNGDGHYSCKSCKRLDKDVSL